ncbi:hypothetical protein ACQKFE_16010 [Stutzerimonas stutzeri]|uniref:hypothetical protein n=1 Tax=Stutzerimonas stutzeri TaxID=316 RepID=UPI003D084159
MIDVEDARQLVGDITKLELELVVKTYKPSTFLGYYACKEQEGPIPNTIGETISSSTSTFTDEDGCVYIFDKTTGEVLHKIPSTNPTKKVVSFSKYVGSDVKFFWECRTKESLLQSLASIDGYVTSNKTSKASDMLVKAMESDCFNKTQLKLFSYILDNLIGWNEYIGNLDDLTASGVDAKYINRTLKELSPHAIRIVERNKPFKGDIVIQVNPFYGWKGDNEYRTSMLKSWYRTLASHQDSDNNRD